MNISTHISRLAKAALAVLTLTVLIVPAAHAVGDTGDDWYRDANAVTTDQPRAAGDTWYRDTSLPVIDQPVVAAADDWYRTANPSAIDETSVAAGDDWYNEAPISPQASLSAPDPVSAGPQPAPGAFDWGDFGIGAASMVGALALLAMLAVIGRAVRRGSQTLSRV